MNFRIIFCSCYSFFTSIIIIATIFFNLMYLYYVYIVQLNNLLSHEASKRTRMWSFFFIRKIQIHAIQEESRIPRLHIDYTTCHIMRFELSGKYNDIPPTTMFILCNLTIFSLIKWTFLPPCLRLFNLTIFSLIKHVRGRECEAFFSQEKYNFLLFLLSKNQEICGYISIRQHVI